MNPNQNARRAAEASKRQSRPPMRRLHMTLSHTRGTVRWLERALQTLPDHLSTRARRVDEHHPPGHQSQPDTAGGTTEQERHDAAGWQHATDDGSASPGVVDLPRYLSPVDLAMYEEFDRAAADEVARQYPQLCKRFHDAVLRACVAYQPDEPEVAELLTRCGFTADGESPVSSGGTDDIRAEAGVEDQGHRRYSRTDHPRTTETTQPGPGAPADAAASTKPAQHLNATNGAPE